MKEKSTAVQNERKANRRISCFLIRKGRGAQFCKKKSEIATLRTAFQDLTVTLKISVSLSYMQMATKNYCGLHYTQQ